MNHTFRGALKRCAVILVLSIPTLGFPVAGWAQVARQGPYIEVATGTRLCLDAGHNQFGGVRGSGKVFCKVMSRPRINGISLLPHSSLRPSMTPRAATPTSERVDMTKPMLCSSYEIQNDKTSG
jgi:hypothetical protein